MVIKRCMTLLEIMIAIALVAIMLGAMAFPISKALKSEQFGRGVDSIINKIQLAQEIMLDFRTDVCLVLDTKLEKEIECCITAATRLPPHIEQGLNHRCKISGIHEIAFNNTRQKTITLYFDGSLGIITEGALSLIAPEKKETLVLPGYPKQIRRGMDVTTLTTTPYPEEIFSAI